MRYYRHNEEEFLVNGHSHLRVATLSHFKRPASPGRIIKVFAVIGPVKQSPANQIKRGAMLCLSFPEMHANARDYTWKRQEETQVKLNVQLHKTRGPLLHDTASPVDTPPIQIKE